jgi:hypothetical protein
VSAPLDFHVFVHARPADIAPGPPHVRAGRAFATLAIPPTALAAPLPVTFEAAGEGLAALPRLYFEPDGSFVWVADDGAGWQVDGVLYDRAGRLLYAELKGRCPAARFDQLLACLGWPAAQLVFQWPHEAVFTDEAEFRRLAQRSATRDPPIA